MRAILLAQFRQLWRNPMPMLMMISMSIIFSVMMSMNISSKVIVPTFYGPELEHSEAERWLALLNRSETYEFELADEAQSRKQVIEGHTDYALQLLANDYNIIAAVDNFELPALDGYIRGVYQEELSIREAEEQTEAVHVRRELAKRLVSPVLRVALSEVEAAQSFAYDSRIQSVFGFALFFSIYTVAFSVNGLLHEKRNGLWDRVILSPASKTSMYAGHMLFSYASGLLQVTIVFALFRYAFHFPLGDNILIIVVIAAVYIFSIVAFSMLLAGLVRTPQQMNVLIPIIAVCFAMLGGAYWPIEIVTNPILIVLSKIVPITYGMEALKGIAYYDYSWQELAEPVAYMFLFGVICMGIGINLIEQRAKK